MHLHMYTYIHIDIYVCIYIYIYTHHTSLSILLSKDAVVSMSSPLYIVLPRTLKYMYLFISFHIFHIFSYGFFHIYKNILLKLLVWLLSPNRTLTDKSPSEVPSHPGLIYNRLMTARTQVCVHLPIGTQVSSIHCTLKCSEETRQISIVIIGIRETRYIENTWHSILLTVLLTYNWYAKNCTSLVYTINGTLCA